uniref:Uncharacterized protein n=1 Tax=Fusarium oxysporum (strain Fo5176) TaxID=660025 RepID=A0A0D2XN80_FUSOF
MLTLACDLTLPTSLGAETVRLREVTACLQEEATPIISRHIDTCFRYRSHLQPFTWPRNCSAGGDLRLVGLECTENTDRLGKSILYTSTVHHAYREWNSSNRDSTRNGWDSE